MLQKKLMWVEVSHQWGIPHMQVQPVYGDRINATIKVQRIKMVRSGENRKGFIIRLLQGLLDCIKHM